MVRSVCRGGPGPHPTTGQKRVSTASRAQPRRAQPRRASPPYPLFFPHFYYLPLPRATLSRRPHRKRKTWSQVQRCRTGGPLNDYMLDLLAYLTDHTTQHTHPHTLTLLLPSSHPHSPTSTYLPPTSHMPDFIRHPERKQETCCLPGKCCLHILPLKIYASQQKNEDD